MQSVTDFDIQALIDNELDWEKEKTVRQYLKDNDWARQRYCELMEQKKRLRIWYTNKSS